MLKPRVGLIAQPVDRPVSAPIDTSFTGRATAAISQYGLTSNMLDASNLGLARARNMDIDITDDELLLRVPEAHKAAVLEERATYGAYAARVYRDQLMEDLENKSVMDNTGLVASMGYGLLALVADPTSLVPMGAAAKAGMTASKVASSVATKLYGAGAGKVAEVATKWAGTSAMESAIYNSPRLAGDHLYEQKQFINDVLLETAMGAGIGSLINTAGSVRAYQRVSHAAKMADIEAVHRKQLRETNNDWSSFELSERARKLYNVTGKKEAFASDTDKWAHEFLATEVETLLSSVDRVQKLKGDVGDAMRGTLQDEIDTVIERMKLHNKTPEDAIAILDDVTDLNKRLSVAAGDYKSIQTLEGAVSVDTIRSIMRESMNTRLETIVGGGDINRLTASQTAKLAAMDLGSQSTRLLSRMRTDVSTIVDAAEAAMKVARISMYYKGRLPSTKEKLLGNVEQLVSAGNYAKANKLLDTVGENIPKDVTGFEFKPERVASMKEDAAVDAVTKGRVSAAEVRRVLDGMANSAEHSDLLKNSLGMKPVFGKVDYDGVAISNELAKAVGSKLWKESLDKLTKGVSAFSKGEMHVVRQATAPQDFVASVGAFAGRTAGLTKDMSTALREQGSTTLEYIGSRLAELGKGYGGATKRRHTAAVIKEAELTKSLSLVLPNYYRHINSWLSSQGHGAVARYNAANKAGAQNKLAAQFNREFMQSINRLHIGKGSSDLHPAIQSMVNDWNKYMSYNFDRLVENGVEGFVKDAKLDNYAPQIWLKHRLTKLVDEGDGRLKEVLVKGYRGAGNENPEQAADNLLKWLKESKDADVLDSDQFMPRQDSRAYERTAIDWSASVNGLSVADLLDMEVPAIATKYSNRMAGWTGIIKATDGLIRNGTDVNVVREMVRVESKDSAKALQMLDDTMDLLFGRPTRGGMPEWVRNIKELATLSKMGGLGAAQLAETGVVATRTIMDAMQDPRMFKKVLKFSKDGEQYNDLVELTKLSGYDADYALLSRQSVNLETMDAGIDGAAAAFNKASDLVTFGSNKAAGSRMLGQITGYDAVRKYQSYAAQRSFGISVARHFKFGKSKISPERLADWGLTDNKGRNSLLKSNIEQHVAFDAEGYPSTFNFDKWDTQAREDFWYAMQRMEAQTQARALVGELPTWMNSPAMGVLMQFRQMSLTTNNKTLARNAAFADKEAMAEMTLAMMTASIVRAGKVYGLAATAAALTGSDLDAEINQRTMLSGQDKGLKFGADMYVNHFGIYADVYNTSAVFGKSLSGDEGLLGMASQVPAMGLLNSMYTTGQSFSEGDLDEAAKNAKGLMLLGNTFVMDAFAKAIEGQLEK